MISHARRHNQMSHWNRAAAVLSLWCSCWFSFRLSNPFGFGSLAFSWKCVGWDFASQTTYSDSLVLEFCDQLPLRDQQHLKDGSHSISGSWQTVSLSLQLEVRPFFLTLCRLSIWQQSWVFVPLWAGMDFKNGDLGTLQESWEFGLDGIAFCLCVH